jgi:hypothetical protein
MKRGEFGRDRKWQAKTPETLAQEFEIYLAYADDGNGVDITTGGPMATFDEWLAR